jgi:predicted transcriptional regulator
MRRALLLSLKSKFAEAIYDGRKRIEFRRAAPRCKLPIEAFIYETLPKGLVTGLVTVSEIIQAPAAQLLTLVSADDPLLTDYRRYLADARRPCALVLRNAVRHESIDLRSLAGAPARPPQSYCYVSIDGFLRDL